MNLYEFIKRTCEGGTKVLPVSYKGKSPIIKGWPSTASNDSKQIERWFKDKQTNAGIPTGKINGFWVLDIDKKNNGYESLAKLENELGPIINQCTYPVDTGGGGLHAYFALRDDEVISSTTNLLPGIDIRGEGAQVVSPFSTHESGNIYIPRIDHEDKTLYVDQLSYAPQSLVDYILNCKKRKMSPMSVGRHVANEEKIKHGERNDQLFRIACRLNKVPIASFEGFEAMIQVENKRLCDPPLESTEVSQIAKSAFYRYSKETLNEPIFDDSNYYGIIGDLVNLIKNETEASSEAIYAQCLIFLGNLCDRKFYFQINGSSIYTNEYALVIGKTSKARKGTSLRACSYFFKKSWGDKFNSRIIRGISTGEGIVWALRDPVTIQQQDKQGKLKLKVIDPGVTDKNAILIEEEFSKPLKNAKRETNNLSEVLRIAYDCENLQSLSKIQPAKVADPNISIIGHTTKEEFIQTLNSIEKDNGMLNRMLFIHSYRKNIISRPIGFDKIEGVESIVFDLILLKDFIEKSDSTEIIFSEDAQTWWDEFYNKHANQEDSINENLKGRTEVHLLKLAMILAIADKEIIIDKIHLEKAKTLVDYSNTSIDYIFSNGIQTKNISSLVVGFIQSKGGSCTRSSISHELFKRKKKSFEIDHIRDSMVSDSKLDIAHDNNTEIWILATYRHGDIGDMPFVDS